MGNTSAGGQGVGIKWSAAIKSGILVDFLTTSFRSFGGVSGISPDGIHWTGKTGPPVLRRLRRSSLGTAWGCTVDFLAGGVGLTGMDSVGKKCECDTAAVTLSGNGVRGLSLSKNLARIGVWGSGIL